MEFHPTTSVAHRSLTTLFSGLPFLDESFKAKELLTAVACVRRHLDTLADEPPLPLAEYLHPAEAYRIARRHYEPHAPVSATDLNAALAKRVRQAVAAIVEVKPAWKPLFSLPLSFYKLVDDRVMSLTNAVIPQKIFLGKDAFETDDDLRETLVHEVSHIWLGLTAEVWRLHKTENPGDLTLPSGTKGKTGTGVLFACLFAAAAIEYHKQFGTERLPRMAFLADYLKGSLNLFDSYDGLTDAGEDVRRRIMTYAAACPF